MKFTFYGIEHPNLKEAVHQALGATINDIAEDMNKYTKYLSGDTEDSMRWDAEDDYNYVVSWNTRYARYAYYKGKPSRAGRRLRWAQYAARQNADKWADDIKKRTSDFL